MFSLRANIILRRLAEPTRECFDFYMTRKKKAYWQWKYWSISRESEPTTKPIGAMTNDFYFDWFLPHVSSVPCAPFDWFRIYLREFINCCPSSVWVMERRSIIIMVMCLRISCNYNNLITGKSPDGHNVVISHEEARRRRRLRALSWIIRRLVYVFKCD